MDGAMQAHKERPVPQLLDSPGHLYSNKTGPSFFATKGLEYKTKEKCVHEQGPNIIQKQYVKLLDDSEERIEKKSKSSWLEKVNFGLYCFSFY